MKSALYVELTNMNRTRLRWKLYNKLNKHYLIFQRKGGYSLEKLISFVETIYWCPTDLSFVPRTDNGLLYIFECIDFAVKKKQEADEQAKEHMANLTV